MDCDQGGFVSAIGDDHHQICANSTEVSFNGVNGYGLCDDHVRSIASLTHADGSLFFEVMMVILVMITMLQRPRGYHLLLQCRVVIILHVVLSLHTTAAVADQCIL